MDYLFAFVYILLGLFGGALHYVKKRYVDNTTLVDFHDYLLGNPKATIKALWTIAAAEIGLSILHAGVGLSLAELVGAVTAGYTADSTLNKAPDAEQVS